MHSRPRWSVRKHHVALALALVAVLSYAYTTLEQRGAIKANVAGILTAVAKDEAANSQLKMFLKLDTIAGEATDERHLGEIDVDSFTLSADRPVGSAKPNFSALKVTMPVSKASPKAFLSAAGALRLSRVVLSVKRAGKNDDFLKWILTDVLITNYQTVGNTHGDGILDQLTLVPGKIEVEYRQQLGDGSLSAVVKAGWDQRTGKSVAY